MPFLPLPLPLPLPFPLAAALRAPLPLKNEPLPLPFPGVPYVDPGPDVFTAEALHYLHEEVSGFYLGDYPLAVVLTMFVERARLDYVRLGDVLGVGGEDVELL